MKINRCFLFWAAVLSLGSIDARLYYIHIPKTGGTSIQTLIEKRIHISELYFHKMCLKDAKENYPPLTQEVVSGHFPLWFCDKLDPFFDAAYKFTVIRDPVERYLSFLRYRKRKNPNYKSLEHVLQTVKQTDDKSNILCKFIANDPQAIGEELLQSAKENVHRLDFIVFFDRFTQDVQKLCGLIGLEWEEEALPHLNKTNLEPVSPELLAEVIRLNELDIAFYEYVKNHYTPKKTCYSLISPFYTDLMTKKTDIYFTFDMPLKGVHWCYRQKDTALFPHRHIYRYVMDKPAEISFCLEPNRDYILEFGAKPIARDVQPQVKVNGVEIWAEKADHETFSTYWCRIPSVLITTGETKFTFFSQKTYQYNILNPRSGDNRNLSFAMDRIKIRAVN